jgi:hypothetical protein
MNPTVEQENAEKRATLELMLDTNNVVSKVCVCDT